MVDRKGAVIMDLLFILMVLFSFAVVTVVAIMVWDEFDAAASKKLNSTSVYDTVGSKIGSTLTGLDYLFAFIIVAFIIASIISVFMIHTHPIFFWISWIGLIIIIMLAAIFSNVFEELTGAVPDEPANALTPAATQLTVIPEVMSNLPLIMLIIAVIVLIALYSKTKSGGMV